MKFRKIIIISIILVVFVIEVVVNNNYTTKEDTYIFSNGTSIALVVDGEATLDIPSKGKYTVDVSCTNADGVWNYDEWKLDISNLNGDIVSCNVTFTTISTIYLNDYVLGLTGTTQGDGEVVEENGNRYEGSDPYNYIMFNGELWRIIGVFDEETHGVTGTNLTKIIKATELDGYAWHKSNTNDWTVSSLNSLLNSYYYYGLDGTDSGYCYGYSTTITKTCNYIKTGINDTYRTMIENVTWYLGGYSSNEATADEFYEYERNGDYVYSGNATSTTGYIGLIYASDYGYSVLSSGCTRTTDLGAYSSSECAGSNWLYGTGTQWTLTPDSSSISNVYSIVSYGQIYTYPTLNCFSIRPTLYLSSSVYILDGTGAINDPYIIAMD